MSENNLNHPPNPVTDEYTDYAQGPVIDEVQESPVEEFMSAPHTAEEGAGPDYATEVAEMPRMEEPPRSQEGQHPHSYQSQDHTPVESTAADTISGSSGAGFSTPEFEEKVLADLADLRNRFTHKLAEDRVKNQLISSVQQSLRERDELARGEAYRAIFKEVLTALDRLIAEEPSQELATSVRDEILDIFAVRGLEPIETEGMFDPARHEVASVVMADESYPSGTIISRERDGFVLGDRVLRPARVTVARQMNAKHAQPAEQQESTNPGYTDITGDVNL